MRFTASSLEDIAKEFDSRAASSRARLPGLAPNVKMSALASLEASTWERAAKFLRETTLTGVVEQEYRDQQLFSAGITIWRSIVHNDGKPDYVLNAYFNAFLKESP